MITAAGVVEDGPRYRLDLERLLREPNVEPAEAFELVLDGFDGE